MSPPLYADWCVPHSTVEALRQQGFSVVEATQTTPPGTSDQDEMQAAASRGAVLMSLNYAERKQWRRWAMSLAERADPGHKPRVILLPSEPHGRRLVARIRLLVAYYSTLSPQPLVLEWHAVEQALIHGLSLPDFDQPEIDLALGRASTA